MWDVATGKCVATLEGFSPVRHAASALCTFCDVPSLQVAVFPDGRRVVSRSANKTLKVWELPRP